MVQFWNKSFQNMVIFKRIPIWFCKAGIENLKKLRSKIKVWRTGFIENFEFYRYTVGFSFLFTFFAKIKGLEEQHYLGLWIIQYVKTSFGLFSSIFFVFIDQKLPYWNYFVKSVAHFKPISPNVTGHLPLGKDTKRVFRGVLRGEYPSIFIFRHILFFPADSAP